MMKRKNVSDLKSHKYKKGLIQTPMNTIPNTKPVSWIDDRLAEYLWLGLILMNYSRTEGIEKVCLISGLFILFTLHVAICPSSDIDSSIYSQSPEA